jgi:hypothetical protein
VPAPALTLAAWPLRPQIGLDCNAYAIAATYTVARDTHIYLARRDTLPEENCAVVFSLDLWNRAAVSRSETTAGGQRGRHWGLEGCSSVVNRWRG